jgi:hypothetical protein
VFVVELADGLFVVMVLVFLLGMAVWEVVGERYVSSALWVGEG